MCNCEDAPCCGCGRDDDEYEAREAFFESHRDDDDPFEEDDSDEGDEFDEFPEMIPGDDRVNEVFMDEGNDMHEHDTFFDN
jgi:hypothetical protein